MPRICNKVAVNVKSRGIKSASKLGHSCNLLDYTKNIVPFLTYDPMYFEPPCIAVDILSLFKAK